MRTTVHRRAPAGRRGSTLVESALVTLLFMTVVFAIMDCGRALFAYNFVCHAAREGTRYAMVHGSTAGAPATADTVRTFVIGQAAALDTASLSVATTWTPNNHPGSTVQVQVAYAFTPVILPTGITLSSTSRMAISQ